MTSGSLLHWYDQQATEETHFLRKPIEGYPMLSCNNRVFLIGIGVGTEQSSGPDPVQKPTESYLDPSTMLNFGMDQVYSKMMNFPVTPVVIRQIGQSAKLCVYSISIFLAEENFLFLNTKYIYNVRLKEKASTSLMRLNFCS